MPIESYFAEITGNADGLIRAAGEGTAAADEMEASLARTQGGMVMVGSSAQEHVGGTAVKNVSLLDKAFGGVFHTIGSVIGSMVSMVGQTAGIGALFGGAAGLAEGVKLALSYNQQMALIAAAYKNVGAAIPTAQITEMLDKETALGFSENETLPALKELAEAHVNITTQMELEATASDLARAKNISLADATDLLLKAAQGTGRGLQDLGINLPAVIPKAAALATATAALHKAQQQYELDLEDFGPLSIKTVEAHDKLSAATQKVSTDTAEMKDHFSQLPATLAAVNSAVGGSAGAYTKADPLATMGADLQSIARVAGEALLPQLDRFAGWVKTNEPEIKTFTTNAIKDLGTAASDAGGFVKNDLYPPVHDVISFVVDHAAVFETAVGALTGLYAAKKIGSGVSTIFSDVKGLVTDLGKVTGLLGSGGSAISKVAPVDVYVVNEGFGGAPGAGGGAAGAAENEGGGQSMNLFEKAAGLAGIAAAVYYIGTLATEHGKPQINPSSRPELDPGSARFGALVTSDQQQITTNYQGIANETGLSLSAATTMEQEISKGQLKTSSQIADYIVSWQKTVSAAEDILLSTQNAAISASELAADLQSLHQSIPGTAKQIGGGRGYFDSSVMPTAPGGSGTTVNAPIQITESKNPQATATAVRNALLNMQGRGLIPRAP